MNMPQTKNNYTSYIYIDMQFFFFFFFLRFLNFKTKELKDNYTK